MLFLEAKNLLLDLDLIQCIRIRGNGLKIVNHNLEMLHTANKFGLMHSRKRISQNSFPNFIYIFPKSFMIFCQELLDPKRNYENQTGT
jgi:hypothetical protein